MNTPLIEMSEDAARAKLKAYKKRLGEIKGKAVSKEVQQQYEALMRGYRALAKGTPLIDLEDAIKACGFDEKGRPKLAISSARSTAVQFHWQNDQASFFSYRGRRQMPTRYHRGVAFGAPPEESARGPNEYGRIIRYEGYAQTPLIPADVRPQYGNELDWFILWEVEKWVDRLSYIMPDRDPYLLKHLGGTLYAVLAEWDLTDLERSVMKGILR